MTLDVGHVLGSYTIEQLVGAGGMGEVYRAWDPKLDRAVAIKVLAPQLALDPIAYARFEREAKAVAALNHPNVLGIYDFGKDGSCVYAVMEFLEGESLRDHLQRGRLPLRRILEIAPRIAEGLAAAHEKGIIHRDLKPENIFLTRDGQVKILDFGLAKALHSDGHGSEERTGGAVPLKDPSLTSPGLVLGTASYMSPEQVRGEPADARSDIFSFGILLYELLVGHRPFVGDTAVETMHRIMSEEPLELPSDLGIPASLENLLFRCLKKRPEERFQSAKDLAFHLTSLTSTGSSSLRAPSERLWKKLQTSLWVFLTAASLVGAWILGKRQRAPLKPQLPSFTSVRYESGQLLFPCLSPDGRTVVYAIESTPNHTLYYSEDFLEGRRRSLQIPPLSIPLSISKQNNLLLILRKGEHRQRMLASMPIDGSAVPRELEESIWDADWMPDGQTYAVFRIIEHTGDLPTTRLEFPSGQKLYETLAPTNHLRVSPDGHRAVFTEQMPDRTMQIKLAEKGGAVRTLLSGLPFLEGLLWSPESTKIYFVEQHAPGCDLKSVDLQGQQRHLHRNLGTISLHGSAMDGRLLVELSMYQQTHRGWLPGMDKEEELGWLPGKVQNHIDEQGNLLLHSAQGETLLYNYKTKTHQRLAQGEPFAFSRKGKLVLTRPQQERSKELLLSPTGAGDVRRIRPKDLGIVDRDLCFHYAVFFQEDSKLMLTVEDAGRMRFFQYELASGKAQEWKPEGDPKRILFAITPDSRTIIHQSRQDPRRIEIYELGNPKLQRELILPSGRFAVGSCTSDGQALVLLMRSEDGQYHTIQMDLKNGRIHILRTFNPQTPVPGAIREYTHDENGLYYAYYYGYRGIRNLFLMSVPPS